MQSLLVWTRVCESECRVHRCFDLDAHIPFAAFELTNQLCLVSVCTMDLISVGCFFGCCVGSFHNLKSFFIMLVFCSLLKKRILSFGFLYIWESRTKGISINTIRHFNICASRLLRYRNVRRCCMQTCNWCAHACGSRNGSVDALFSFLLSHFSVLFLPIFHSFLGFKFMPSDDKHTGTHTHTKQMNKQNAVVVSILVWIRMHYTYISASAEQHFEKYATYLQSPFDFIYFDFHCVCVCFVCSFRFQKSWSFFLLHFTTFVCIPIESLYHRRVPCIWALHFRWSDLVGPSINFGHFTFLSLCRCLPDHFVSNSTIRSVRI